MGDRINIPQKRARVIAFYLPQYHPIEINDKYWGKGFTEWRNVTLAKPLFRGHYQPHLPADLGFYDLRIPEVREEQALLAEEAGVEGFCYWHYWFKKGEEVLERPLDEVVRLKKPNFPFCIGWANHSWKTSTWTKLTTSDQYIFKQEYLGNTDHIAHFYRLLDAFRDERYIKVEGKLLFIIYDILGFENFLEFKSLWNQLAIENNLPGFYFVSHMETVGHISVKTILTSGYIDKMINASIKNAFLSGADGIGTINMRNAEFKAYGKLCKLIYSASRRYLSSFILEKYDFKKIIQNILIEQNKQNNVFPEIINGNDRSPRAGRKAIIYYNVTPDSFYDGAKKVIDYVQHKDYDHRIIFLNSWNEWGEGMHMEPDLKYGKGFINALRDCLDPNLC